MKIVLLRHGETLGNREKRYIGRTDEDITKEAEKMLKENVSAGKYPMVKELYVSPLKRCIQTADILYPDIAYRIVQDFRECDFGTFENKNYHDLAGNSDYQAFIDSGGIRPFPEGEGMEQFQRRTVNQFLEITKKSKADSIGIVAHGGSIMAILSYFNRKSNYYDWMVANGSGYQFLWDVQTQQVTGVEKINV